jgi:hypothetical protein
MADWKFSRRRDRCSACEAVFDEDGRHVSTLLLRAEELTREDLCLACWERSARGDEIFFWYTRQCSERRGLHLDLPTLEQLFLRLEGREATRMLEMRYILALLLMRKKRLKLVRIERQPRETLVVRRPRREEVLSVVVFDFSPERMEELRRELVEIFDGAEGLPDPERANSGHEEAGPSPDDQEAGEERPPALTAGV